MFDNLKNEKNGKRYTERKLFENSDVSVAATISISICSVSMEFCLTISGLYILTDLTNIRIFIPKGVSGKAMYYEHGPKTCQIITNVGNR